MRLSLQAFAFSRREKKLPKDGKEGIYHIICLSTGFPLGLWRYFSIFILAFFTGDRGELSRAVRQQSWKFGLPCLSSNLTLTVCVIKEGLLKPSGLFQCFGGWGADLRARVTILTIFLSYCHSLSLAYLLIFFCLPYFSLYNSVVHYFNLFTMNWELRR